MRQQSARPTPGAMVHACVAMSSTTASFPSPCPRKRGHPTRPEIGDDLLRLVVVNHYRSLLAVSLGQVFFHHDVSNPTIR